MVKDFNKVLNKIKFDAQGLVPVITQDHKDGDILMLAWMNKDALLATINTKMAVYYSRSRKKLWQKGESSGYTQKVVEILCDCDCDAILLKVVQKGGISCHTGKKSCFFNKLSNNNWQTILNT